MLKRISNGCYIYENTEGKFYIFHDRCMTDKYKIYNDELKFITTSDYISSSIDAINEYILNN